jgi:hypothetical protein
VLSRLEGGSGNRVLKLVTPFGGGKSHTLASLLHSAEHRKALDVIPEGAGLPKPGAVRICSTASSSIRRRGKKIRKPGFRPGRLGGGLPAGSEASFSVRSLNRFIFREEIQDQRDPDSRSRDTRFSEAHLGIDRDPAGPVAQSWTLLFGHERFP